LTQTTASDLIVTNGAVAMVSSPGLNLRNLLIASNSFMTATSNQPTSSLVLNLSGTASIQTGGGVIFDGGGYTGAQTGPGFGASFSANGSSAGAGGGYGGNGGACVYGGPGGSSYGSPTQPTQPGSNGGHGNGNFPANIGGSGGGCVQI